MLHSLLSSPMGFRNKWQHSIKFTMRILLYQMWMPQRLRATNGPFCSLLQTPPYIRLSPTASTFNSGSYLHLSCSFSLSECFVVKFLISPKAGDNIFRLKSRHRFRQSPWNPPHSNLLVLHHWKTIVLWDASSINSIWSQQNFSSQVVSGLHGLLAGIQTMSTLPLF